MIRRTIDPYFPHPRDLREAERALNHGSILIFPTETVYGIGCLYSDLRNLQRIWTLKGRPARKPVALMFASPERAVRFLRLSGWVERVVRHFLPAPLTIVCRPGEGVGLNSYVRSPEGTVGIRVPDHPVALALLALVRAPLAVTSANRSGEPAPADPKDIPPWREPDLLLLDAGQAGCGVASTVIRLHEEEQRVEILREGAIPAQEILQEVERLGADTGLH